MTNHTRFLNRPEGKIAYDLRGEGPLLICMPGMGDLRQSYRFLAPLLAEAGHRVATMDLRGLGESTAGGWSSYGQRPMGEDALALIEELGGGPAVLIGNSFTPDAAIHAAVCSSQVRAVVAIAPWARRPKMGFVMDWLSQRVVRSPTLWGLFYKSLHPGAKPPDFRDYLRRLKENLREPGRAEALARIAAPESVDATEDRQRMKQPALILMGERDPDFKDPAAEAAAMHADLPSAASAAVVMIPEAGHYPQAQQAPATAAAILSFLRELPDV